MRIDSAAVPAAPLPRRSQKADQPAETPPAAAQISAPTGHGKGAEHRSDVATLRQWVNHPEQRSAITVPDLTASHHGHGFAKAVAAYQQVLAELAPPPPPVPPAVEPPVGDPPVDALPVVDPHAADPVPPAS